MARPAGLIYGLDDRPPWPTLFLLAVQHIMLLASALVLPIVLVGEIGGSFADVQAVVALSMIAGGLGTILQALRLPGIGSGYLCPNVCGPNFFAAAMSAAWLGGLPLMRGMTIVAGITEMVLSRFVHRLAFLFPTEVIGLVVFMVGVGIVPVGSSKFMHVGYAGEPISGPAVAIALATLALMVGFNVWGRGPLRLFGVLIAAVAGYGMALLAGLLSAEQFRAVAAAPWLGLPLYEGMLDIDFRWSLVPVFVIVSITGALKSFGNLVMAEKINDEAWQGPDTKRIGNGLMADGAALTLSGVIGGMATDTSSSNVALSGTSGATSRVIAFAAGGLFILLGFSPKLAAVLSVMPDPVAGAILVFVTCFMLVSGLQIVFSTRLDPRRTFVVGIAMCFGLSVLVLPELYVHVPRWLGPLVDSSLTLATVIAVILFQLLRIGDKPEAAPGQAGPSEKTSS